MPDLLICKVLLLRGKILKYNRYYKFIMHKSNKNYKLILIVTDNYTAPKEIDNICLFVYW